ncbi:hypothetical protein KV205_07785 [Streptomyces sp. SKN60]|uniref:DUF6204 family protein n=1 Tax=Streptomyces sp. SKN60 TaxID=2855506 RepID=UPI00224547EB|nr:DUF6204 family protein [Streptomyces sp. SKN60]MCX2180429.1 hypothetical protein [Streptomyces sp. SKN60]
MSEQHTYRVIVRGTFENLSEESRTRLLAEADDHGLSAMQFTEDGSLAYDRTLKHFSYRLVVLSDAADGDEMAGAIAEDRVERALGALGHGFGGLKSKVTDMDTMKINYKR